MIWSSEIDLKIHGEKKNQFNNGLKWEEKLNVK